MVSSDKLKQVIAAQGGGFDNKDAELHDLLDLADQRMYEAKRARKQTAP